MMATKVEERKALEQIRKIVAGLGEESYIGRAFEGCFEMAEENINCDFWNSPKECLQTARNNAESERMMADCQRKQVMDLKAELELAKETCRKEADRANEWIAKYNEMSKANTTNWNDLVAAENKVADLEDEIIHLKAKLFDMMMAAEK